jgi:signal peptidase II
MVRSAIHILLFFALDQLSKLWAEKALALESRKLGPMLLTLVHNRGAAFGLGQNLGQLILILSGIFLVLGVVILWLWPPKTNWGRWGLILLLAGAGGNFCDRVRLGAVVDFLDFQIWPVFNLADTWITFGTIFLAIALWKTETQGGK